MVTRLKRKSHRDGKLVHPGEVLLDEILTPYGISQNELAEAMGVSPRRINEIVLGKRAITAETALGLEDVLGLPARYWLALQADYEIEKARLDWICRRAGYVPPHKPGRELPSFPLDSEVEVEDLETGYDATRYGR